jgi:alkaline phosphatase
MVEGGKIDWACHANDAGTTIQEVLAFDEAIAAALSFYQKYPDETIIVVTADHETGGLSLGYRESKYDIDLAVLQHQRSSAEKLNGVMKAFREKKTGKEVNDFKKLIELLNTNLGLNDPEKGTLLTGEEKESLLEMMKASVYDEKAEYEYEPLTGLALQILSNKAGVAWGTGSHTFMTVPVYAIGAGAEQFTGVFDNTELPGKLERLLGLR